MSCLPPYPNCLGVCLQQAAHDGVLTGQGIGVQHLGSGSVIHAMHHALHKIHSNDDAQDMRNMGGLKSAMPITFLTFLVSTIAISGIPGFSGFFSKDEILWMAFANPYHGNLNIVLWGIGAIAACFTAFYMFRLVFMTFFGECRINPKAKGYLHESPLVITIPLMVEKTSRLHQTKDKYY